MTLDANNVATRCPIVEWSARKYTESGALAAMLKPVENIVYFRSAEPTADNTYTYIPVGVNDLQFVSGIASGNADSNSENSKRYMSYVNLKTEGLYGDKTVDGATVAVQKNVLYKKNDAGEFVAFAEGEDPNDVFESVGGARVWRNGNTYYYHEISHLGTTGKDAAGNRFNHGVVRNHIYEVQINSVFGLGTPVLSPEDETGSGDWEPIIPQKPLHDTFFLGARVNILSWRVVANDITLDWSK